MRATLAAITIAIATGSLVAGPIAGEAQSFVNETACDSIIVEGRPYTVVEFQILNQHPTFPIYSFALHPVAHEAPDDTCHIVQSTPPANWESFHVISGGTVFSSTTLATGIPGGGDLGGFEIAMSRRECCYSFQFFGVFELPWAIETVCFECDRATDAERSTWGRLKEVYR